MGDPHLWRNQKASLWSRGPSCFLLPSYFSLKGTRTPTQRGKLKKRRVPFYSCLSFRRPLCLGCSRACYPPSLCASASSQPGVSPWRDSSFCLSLRVCLSHISEVYWCSPLWVEINPSCYLFPCIHFPVWMFTHFLSWVPDTHKPSSKPFFLC